MTLLWVILVKSVKGQASSVKIHIFFLIGIPNAFIFSTYTYSSLLS